jgi:hypothetical protein
LQKLGPVGEVAQVRASGLICKKYGQGVKLQKSGGGQSCGLYSIHPTSFYEIPVQYCTAFDN